MLGLGLDRERCSIRRASMLSLLKIPAGSSVQYPSAYVQWMRDTNRPSHPVQPSSCLFLFLTDTLFLLPGLPFPVVRNLAFRRAQPASCYSYDLKSIGATCARFSQDSQILTLASNFAGN